MGDSEGGGDVSGLMTWARSQASGLPQDRAQVRAMGLAPGSYEGTVQHPFPVADREAYLKAVRPMGIAKRSMNAPIGRIRLDALKGIQKTVNSERLGQHLQNPMMVETGSRASGSGALVDLPIIVKIGGEYYVHDGHHRLTASHLRGEQDARVRLVDLDPEVDAASEDA